jgi:hypothetical protein
MLAKTTGSYRLNALKGIVDFKANSGVIFRVLRMPLYYPLYCGQLCVPTKISENTKIYSSQTFKLYFK